MKVLAQVAIASVLLLWLSGSAADQVCNDRDGDQARAGSECGQATDCDDGSWTTNPGALETCDGWDTDCDGAIDETCDRYCDTPDLYDVPRPLEFGVQYPLGDFYVPECFEFSPHGLLGMTETGTEQTRLLTMRAFDAEGRTLDHPHVLDSRQVQDWLAPSFGSHCDIARGDDHYLVLWFGENTSPAPTTFLARVVDRLGAPIGPTLDITDLSGVEKVRGTTEWVGTFNGTDFAVFWTPGGVAANQLLMTTIGWNGRTESVQTVLVTDDVDGEQSLTDQVRSIWAGDRYVVVLAAGESSKMFTMAVDEEGTILSGPHQLGFGGGNCDVVMDDGGPVAFHVEQTASYDIVHVLLLDPVTAGPRGSGPSSLILPSSEPLRVSGLRAAWNGEMLGVVASSREWNGTLYEQEIWFWRMLSGGTLLDPLGIKLDSGENWRDRGVRKIGWGGHAFHFMSKYANLKIGLAKIVCDCGDADGDHFDACVVDCNDTDPLVNGLATEQCTGGIDDDCDYLVDCADPECPGGPSPPAVQNLEWSGEQIVWPVGEGAQRWDLARGVLTDVLRRGDFEMAECAGRELESSSWQDDGRLPPIGDVLWFLVRPEGQPCAVGPWSANGTSRSTRVCD